MPRSLPAALLITAVLAAAAIWAASAATPPRVSVEGPVWRYRERNLLYRFHASFREEGLFDTAADPYETRDLRGDRPADLGRLRAGFLKRVGAPSLEKVPASGENWKNDAEGLGYR